MLDGLDLSRFFTETIELEDAIGQIEAEYGNVFGKMMRYEIAEYLSDKYNLKCLTLPKIEYWLEPR